MTLCTGKKRVQNDEDENNNSLTEEDEDENDEDLSDDQVEDDDNNNTRMDIAGEDFTPEVVDSVGETISKIRRIAKFFRKRVVKNDLLQGEIQLKFGKPLAFLIDCRTRWNSMVTMINRFLNIYEILPDEIKHYTGFEDFPTEKEIANIKDLCKSLEIL